MTINEYQNKACELKGEESDLILCALGISGEGGEVADLMKKHIYHKHELNKENLAKELGDICWYITVMADFIGYDFESILQMNLDKLNKRYPNGFDPERSINRKLYEN